MTKIKRRDMLRTIGGITLGGLLPASGKAAHFYKISGKKIKKIRTDVLVIGGGTAGVIAAIQSARTGCSTMIVENGSQLGGTITTAGVAFPGLFYAWGRQIISGIGWELVNDAVKMDDGTLPDFSTAFGKRHWEHQIRINGPLYALLAEEKCLEAGVQIRYYESPVSIKFKENTWEVETIGKGSHVRIFCNQLIDCTGDAAVVSLAGFTLLREKETQPGTLMFRIGGYDIRTLDTDMIRERYDEEVERGSLAREDFLDIIALLQKAGDNIQHVAGADSSSSETHTITNIKGRTSLLKTLRFLRTLPGCEKTRLISMQTEAGVRETYRIDGIYSITLDDYTGGKVFEDSVCYSYYPIDLHNEQGVTPKHLTEGTVATVPLRALIPKNSLNMIVAGRCVSSDRLANSALRVQASCMAMGQAAGAASALAFKLRTYPLGVPVEDIRRLIREHGGITP